MGALELSIGSISLVVDHAQGRTALGELFGFDIHAHARTGAPAIAELLGAEGTLTIPDGFNQALVVHGIVTSVERTPAAEGGVRFQITLAPAAAALAIGQNSRLFQEMSVVDVVKKVLAVAGLPATSVRWSVTRSYAPRPYWVQYGESDWELVERLIAEEGIYYWFDFTDDATVLVFADDSTAAPAIAGAAQLPFRRGAGLDASDEAITRVVRAVSVAPTAVRLREYDFAKPRLTLDAKAGQGAHERYDFPGRFTQPTEGDARARIELEALRAGRARTSGHAATTRLRAGMIFEIEGHPLAALDGRYLVASASYRAARTQNLVVAWSAIPVATPYRMMRAAHATRGPGGPQTGEVVGASGQEIHPDASGRIRVQLRWDREGKRDDHASTWMRVGQFATGGSMIIPRIGWDVLVHHREGDVDAPLAITHLYDGQHPVPYALPANKTRTAWQTATTPGGGSTNEIRFEDKKGSEEIFINASKDMNVVIGDNRQEKVGVDHEHKIGANLDIHVGARLKEGVGAKQDVSIGGSETLNVSAGRTVTVKGSETVTIGGSRSVTATGGSNLDATGGRTLTVGGSMMSASALAVARTALGSLNVTVGGSWISAAGTGLANVTGGAAAETVGAAKIHLGAAGCETTVKGAFAETVGGAYVIAAGGNAGEKATGSLALTIGGAFLANAPSIEIEADTEISIRCGGSSLSIKPGSVEVKAPSLASPGAVITKKASQVNHN